MAFDDHKNFAATLVVTAPTPAASGTTLTAPSAPAGRIHETEA